MPYLNSYSTAIEALRGANLEGKIAIVTGGNSGIGVDTVKALAYGGAKVYMTSRNMEKGEAVARELTKEKLKGSIHVLQLDLADLKSVHQFSHQFMSKEKRLHYLICNAGLITNKPEVTKQGIEMTLGTNHIGHYALVRDLQDFMVKQNVSSRIIVVSSGQHQAGSLNFSNLNQAGNENYYGLKAYSDSKICNILHAKYLAHILQNTKIRAFSLHPGVILSTGMPGSVTPSFKTIQPYLIFAQKFLAYISGGQIKDSQQGAATTIYAALAKELDPFSGAYLYDCSLPNQPKYTKNVDMAVQLNDKSEDILKEAESK